jgi:hypothetical protein
MTIVGGFDGGDEGVFARGAPAALAAVAFAAPVVLLCHE